MDAAARSDGTRREDNRAARAVFSAGTAGPVGAAFSRRTSIAAAGVAAVSAILHQRRDALPDSLSAVFFAGDGDGCALDAAVGGDGAVSCGVVVAVDDSSLLGALRVAFGPDFVEAGDSKNSSGPVSGAKFRRIRDRASDRRQCSERGARAGGERRGRFVYDARSAGEFSGGFERRPGGYSRCGLG